MTTQTTRPEWDTILSNFSEEHRNDFKRLQEDSRRLRRVSATGAAIIHYLASDEANDEERETLQYVFFLLCTMREL